MSAEAARDLDEDYPDLDEDTDEKWCPNPEGRGADGSRRYIIAKWSPRHDIAVVMHIAGKKNSDISEAMGWTMNHVSIVLNQPRAQQMIAEARERLLASSDTTILERVVELSTLATDRLRETMETKFMVGTRQKMHQDNTSVKILQGAGYLAGKPKEEEGKDTDRVTASLVERLSKSLEKAAKARKEARDAIDADFTVVEKTEDAPSES